jgi:asparagine synthase (glutamine-hydrolysing)
MCGIFAILGSKEDPQVVRQKALSLSKRIRHRGPDWNGIYVDDKRVLCHERLGIVDPVSGAQPLFNQTGTVALTVNGEIYNHKSLRQSLFNDYNFKTASDCEVIIPLWEKFGVEACGHLDGMFSFVLTDSVKDTYLVARDPLGITSLYIGWHKDGSVWVASELKSLMDDCERYEAFPPGHYYTPETGFKRYYEPFWWTPEYIPQGAADLTVLRESLEKAVVKRLMTDVPYGVLISGGLDSSLVGAIASRHAAMRVEEEEKEKAWWPQIHSFSIGLPNSPDLRAAREAAKFLGTIHHEFNFTVQEGIDALADVIWHLETYDVTSIRASTPMYFLARKIKAMGVKMVLSGEGADEVFGGYLYFHNAPSPAEFHQEALRRVKNLHYFDLLRANKSTMAWGLEVRVPFLDKEFLDVAMNIRPEDKVYAEGKMEKYVLRKAFDTPEKPYLPDNILWRQKEQFSDGVGYGWIDGLKDYAESQVTDEELASAAEKFPYNSPDTKEAYLFRKIFESLFHGESAQKTVEKWIPTWGKSKDPSGRVQLVHEKHTDAPLQHDKDY